MDHFGLKSKFTNQDKYNKRRHTYKLIVIIVILCTLPVAFALAISSQVITNKGNATKDISKPATYKYEELGKSCSNGITEYDTKIENQNQIIAKTSQTADAQYKSIADQSAAYRASQQAAYDKSFSDSTKSFNTGLISADEYFREINALKPVADNIVNSSSLEAQQTTTLSQSYIAIIQQQKNDLEKLKDNRSKLSTCVDSAKAHADFSVSDVANFESIIAH